MKLSYDYLRKIFLILTVILLSGEIVYYNIPKLFETLDVGGKYHNSYIFFASFIFITFSSMMILLADRYKLSSIAREGVIQRIYDHSILVVPATETACLCCRLNHGAKRDYIRYGVVTTGDKNLRIRICKKAEEYFLPGKKVLVNYKRGRLSGVTYNRKMFLVVNGAGANI